MSNFDELRKRTRSALIRNGYRTRGQLATATDAELRGLRNVGSVMVEEIRQVIPYVGPLAVLCSCCKGAGYTVEQTA